MPTEQTKNVTQEAEQIARTVRTWLNGYSGKPMDMVDVEFLGETAGLALETIQAAYKTRQYITGGYMAQYQFAILYRTIPGTAGERLTADEILNDYAAWAEANPPELPSPCQLTRIQRNTNAALLNRAQTGAETHQILMSIFYEVNV